VGWTASANLGGVVNFLPDDPAALAGMTVTLLADADPALTPLAMLEAYLLTVQETNPDVIISDTRVDTSPSPALAAVSTTYVLPYRTGRLVYRVTILAADEGTAYRLLQWAPEATYESVYRAAYRAVVAGFLPAEQP
jgi:hypothetical protein